MSSLARFRPRQAAFRHEALLYAGDEEFLAGTVPFIRDGLEGGEPVLVVVDSAKIAGLRAELGAGAGDVRFADMQEVGANPARIIPAWREFVNDHTDGRRPLRGIGEPISAGRSAAELVECQRHESLLNLAFADAGPFRLLCPYDTASLDAAVIEEAHRSHPVVVHDGTERDSTGYEGIDALAAPFARPLPEPPATPDEIAFDIDDLSQLRAFVARRARGAGLSEQKAKDLIVAVNEVATNSIRYSSGQGRLLAWAEGDALVCEVRDDGEILEPLVGRERPAPGRIGGHGLWLANQLCELVQVRSFPDGSVVRLHAHRA